MEFTDPELPVGPSSVGAFWQWAFSTLADNALRGVFAEFVVGLALGVLDTPRTEWDAADLKFRGQLIEVKSSADNQVWSQEKPSTIRFDIAKKKSWNAQTNEFASTASRIADVYVFCHYRGSAATSEVVDLGRWDFYPVATSQLDEQLADQKSLGLRRLRQLQTRVGYTELRNAIESIF